MSRASEVVFTQTESPVVNVHLCFHTHWCSINETDVAPSGTLVLTMGVEPMGTICSIYLCIYCVYVCTHTYTRGQPQVSAIPQKQ